ncbi:photosystem I reaction centre subunit IV/PsaE [Stanieria sp. NIES-3757]|nr:photosystem I reaction centre subunit IV/PsaE [Stanieria sp. NIES-3757]
MNNHSEETKNQQSEPTPSNEINTPIEAEERRTGQGTDTDVREGAEPEAPGSTNPQVEGDPNQGTEAR